MGTDQPVTSGQPPDTSGQPAAKWSAGQLVSWSAGQLTSWSGGKGVRGQHLPGSALKVWEEIWSCDQWVGGSIASGQCRYYGLGYGGQFYCHLEYIMGEATCGRFKDDQNEPKAIVRSHMWDNIFIIQKAIETLTINIVRAMKCS